jgi:hypothetical protein
VAAEYGTAAGQHVVYKANLKLQLTKPTKRINTSALKQAKHQGQANIVVINKHCAKRIRACSSSHAGNCISRSYKKFDT